MPLNGLEMLSKAGWVNMWRRKGYRCHELGGGFMPTISMFYGILVLMFFRDNRRHHLPHIHVRYQNDETVVSIEEGYVVDGTGMD